MRNMPAPEEAVKRNDRGSCYMRAGPHVWTLDDCYIHPSFHDERNDKGEEEGDERDMNRNTNRDRGSLRAITYTNRTQDSRDRPCEICLTRLSSESPSPTSFYPDGRTSSQEITQLKHQHSRCGLDIICLSWCFHPYTVSSSWEGGETGDSAADRHQSSLDLATERQQAD
jgi:hypothetical protein